MIGNDWDEKLSIIWHSPGFKKFMNIVEREYNTKIIYPPKNYIFNALKLTPEVYVLKISNTVSSLKRPTSTPSV